MVYSPPVKVRTVQIPYRVAVLRADPSFEQAKRKEPFYEFSNGRTFYENTATKGAYSSAPHDNP
jgi:hypothetical protein